MSAGKEESGVRSQKTEGAADGAALLRELSGHVCRCGKKKKFMQTFCRDCYCALPFEKQRALFRSLGNGYEEAYAAAVAALDDMEVR